MRIIRPAQEQAARFREIEDEARDRCTRCEDQAREQGARESASASENDSTRAVRDTVRGSRQQPKAGSGGAIRRLFRQASRC